MVQAFPASFDKQSYQKETGPVRTWLVQKGLKRGCHMCGSTTAVALRLLRLRRLFLILLWVFVCLLFRSLLLNMPPSSIGCNLCDPNGICSPYGVRGRPKWQQGCLRCVGCSDIRSAHACTLKDLLKKTCRTSKTKSVR